MAFYFISFSKSSMTQSIRMLVDQSFHSFMIFLIDNVERLAIVGLALNVCSTELFFFVNF